MFAPAVTTGDELEVGVVGVVLPPGVLELVGTGTGADAELEGPDELPSKLAHEMRVLFLK